MKNNAFTFKRHFIVPAILLLWGLSIIPRTHYFSEQPAVNNVAHLFTLTTLHIWQQEGPIASNLTLKQTYLNKGDRFNTYYVRYMDKRGNNYYVSHPPGATVFAYLLSFGGLIPTNNLFLIFLALLIHLGGAILIALIVMQTTGYANNAFAASLIAAAIYLFHPILMYMHTFHFFSETVGQFFALLGLYLLIKFSITNRVRFINLNFVFLILAGFCMAWTEWFGVFLIGSAFFLLFLLRNKTKEYRAGVGAMAIGASAGILVFVFQHISLNDTETFVRAMAIRFLERSGFFGNEYTDMGYSYINPESWKLLLLQIWETLNGVGIVLLFFLGTMLFIRKKTIVFSDTQQFILKLSILSCLFYLIALFSASVTHYIYFAKWIIPLSLFSGFFVNQIHFKIKLKRASFLFLVAFALGIILLWSVNVFKTKADLQKQADEKLVAFLETVSANCIPENSLFLEPIDDYPSTTIIFISWFLQRNISYRNTLEEANASLLKFNQKNGTFIQANFLKRKVTFTNLPSKEQMILLF